MIIFLLTGMKQLKRNSEIVLFQKNIDGRNEMSAYTVSASALLVHFVLAPYYAICIRVFYLTQPLSPFDHVQSYNSKSCGAPLYMNIILQSHGKSWTTL